MATWLLLRIKGFDFPKIKLEVYTHFITMGESPKDDVCLSPPLSPALSPPLSPALSVEPPPEDKIKSRNTGSLKNLVEFPAAKPKEIATKRSRRDVQDGKESRKTDKRPKKDDGRKSEGRRTRRIVVTGRELNRLYASDFFQIFSQFGTVVGVDRYEDEVYVSFETEGGADRAVRTRRLEIDGMAIYATFGRSDRYRRTTEEGRRPRHSSRHDHSRYEERRTYEMPPPPPPAYGYGPSHAPSPYNSYGPPTRLPPSRDRSLGQGAYGRPDPGYIKDDSIDRLRTNCDERDGRDGRDGRDQRVPCKRATVSSIKPQDLHYEDI